MQDRSSRLNSGSARLDQRATAALAGDASQIRPIPIDPADERHYSIHASVTYEMKSNTPPGTARPLECIEVLRGLAASSVVFFHVGLMAYVGIFASKAIFLGGLFSWGALGVDCFFCISGFIITLVHGKDIGYPQRSQAFAFKRFSRIYPPYFVMILFSTTHFLLSTPHRPVSVLTERLLTTLFLLPTGYSMLAVSWTLTFEFFFYLLFLLAIVTGKNCARFGIAVWVIAVLAYSFNNPLPADWQIGDLVFSPYILQFLLGALAANLLKLRITQSQAVGFLALAILVIASGVASHRLNIYSGQIRGGNELWQKVVWGICLSLIILALAVLERIRNWHYPRILLLLGAASYSIYLVHLIVFLMIAGFVQKISPAATPVLFQAVLVGSGVLAVLVGIAYHVLIEKPVIKRFRTCLIPTAPSLVALDN